MEEQGWVALPLASQSLFARAGLPHERAPGARRSWNLERPGLSTVIDKIWVPRWAKVLLDAMNYRQSETKVALLKWAANELDVPECILVCEALGGTEAVRKMVEASW
jgi:hypothetical protein